MSFLSVFSIIIALICLFLIIIGKIKSKLVEYLLAIIAILGLIFGSYPYLPPAVLKHIPNLSSHFFKNQFNLATAKEITSFNIVSSSTRVRNNEYDIDYFATNLLGSNSKVAWVEGVDGDGIGEFVTFTYIGNSSFALYGIGIDNGYVKSDRSFNENGSPSKIDVSINGVPSCVINLKRTSERQYYVPDNAPLISPGDEIKFTILSVDRGEDEDLDTAISKIKFYSN